MRAVCWTGRNSVEVQDVPEPQILNSHDAIVRVTSAAICGSDLHLYDGYVPGMKKGDILGHEFMGDVVELGRRVAKLQVGDRVVVPFPISCGSCNACVAEQWSLCESSNPNSGLAEKLWGHPCCGIFGYSHLTGGFAGGQAEYVRVPFADVGPLKLENGFSDEQVLLLSDIFPTAYMGAELCDIQPGDVVAVWGAGPVGLLAAKSAFLLGAERDRGRPLRLPTAHGPRPRGRRDPRLRAGRRPGGAQGADRRTRPGRVHRRGRDGVAPILSCRSGVVSVVGVYGGLVDKFPLGAIVNRSLTIRSGQCHVHRYLRPLLERIEAGDVDPSFVITHRFPLDEAPTGYELFKNKQEDCVKVVLTP